SRDQNPFTVVAGLFRRRAAAPVAVPTPAAPTDSVAALQEQTGATVSQPTSTLRPPVDSRPSAPTGRGWRSSLSLSPVRDGPPAPVGGNVIDFDPERDCAQRAQGNPLILDQCIQSARLGQGTQTPIVSQTQGGPIYRIPTQTNVNGNVGFNLTPKWSAAWST